jgi:hypothetical protein
MLRENLLGYVYLWAWGSIVVKTLRYSRKVSGSIPGIVAGDFFP